MTVPSLSAGLLIAALPIAAAPASPVEAPAPAGATLTPERYVELVTATLEEKATAADLERLLGLYAEDAVYEHPRAGMRIAGKGEIRAAMTRFLGATRRPAVRLRQSVGGRDVLVLSLEVTAEARSETAWVPLARTQVIVLELAAGRIRRILDYW